MKKTSIFTAIAFTLPFMINAQTVDLPTDYVRNTITGKIDVPENVEGSPYLQEEFQSGKLVTKDKSINSLIRYNIYNDEFQIAVSEDEVIALRRTPGMTIELNGKNFSIFPYNSGSGTKQAYFEVLSNGDKIMVLKKHTAEFTEAQKAANSYASDKPARFSQESEYYLKLADQPAVQIDLKKKDVIRFFDSKEITEYIKNKNLKFKEEEELIQLAQYFERS